MVPTATEQVKTLDFGVAKRFARSDKSSTAEKTRALAGTPTSMSPEVLLENHPDRRADIFSLGVVFYEALSGRHPFQARSFVATSNRILRDSPPPLRRRNPGDISNVVRMGTFLMSVETRLASSLTARFVRATLQLLRFGHPESLL
jgi:serine/threonine protein kinase